MTTREEIIAKIIKLILEEMEEEGKGNLTIKYTIGILEETIAMLELNALMHPVRDCISD